MGKEYLVTGGAGFIGTALCRHLDSVGASFTGIGRQEFIRLKSLLLRYKPRVIFHLAGGRVDDPLKMATANILTTIDLFETCRLIPQYHPRVIVVGSAAEYGNRPSISHPILENSPADPTSLYGWVKLMETETALHYSRLGEDVVVARLFNILGPGIPDSMVAGKFAREITALENRASPKAFRVGDLGGARDFLDIRDVCKALHILSDKGKSGEIYNICSQKSVVMRDLLSMMIAASHNCSITYKEDRRKKPGVRFCVGSCVKFRRISHWRPKYDIRRSIEDTLEHYRKRL